MILPISGKVNICESPIADIYYLDFSSTYYKCFYISSLGNSLSYYYLFTLISFISNLDNASAF